MTIHKWDIPLHCYHDCELLCCDDILLITEDGVNLVRNMDYDPDTGRCKNYNKLTRTTVDIESYNFSKPYGAIGKLYYPELVVIPDTSFDVMIKFPLTHPSRVNVNVSKPVSLRVLLNIIKQIYIRIYDEEEKTAAATDFTLNVSCECASDSSATILESYESITELKDDCSICYYPFESSETIELNCKHLFHKQCLKQWIDRGRGVSCPLCRATLNSCERCNNTKIITTVSQYVVLPVHLRTTVFSLRNHTNGTYGIHSFDLDKLQITKMRYNSKKKVLKLSVDSSIY